MAYYRRHRTTRRSRSGRSYSPRRQSVWIRTLTTSTVGTVAQLGVDLIPASAIDRGSIIGATVTRARISVQINCGAVTTVFPGFYTGVYVGNAGQLAGQMPSSGANVVDWMHWKFNSVAFPGTGIFASATENAIAVDIDVKAQRKLSQPADTLILALENGGITPTVGAVVAASVLLKLS